MFEGIVRFLPFPFQAILIQLFLSCVIIFFEISLSRMYFLYEMSPLFLFIFIYFWIIEINFSPYWVYFVIGLFCDLFFSSILGLISFSLLISVGLLRFVNAPLICTNFSRKLLIFTVFLLILQSIQLLLFFIIYFQIPNFEKFLFQILVTIMLYPILNFCFNPIKLFINNFLRQG